MLTAENYHLAWFIYAAASVGLLLVLARMIWSLKTADARLWLLVSAACLLFVPVRADPEQTYLAPATLVFLIEVIFIEGEAGTRVLPLLLLSLVVVWSVLAASLLGKHFYDKTAAKKRQTEIETTAAEQERETLLEESFAVNNNNR